MALRPGSRAAAKFGARGSAGGGVALRPGSRAAARFGARGSAGGGVALRLGAGFRRVAAWPRVGFFRRSVASAPLRVVAGRAVAGCAGGLWCLAVSVRARQGDN